MPFLNGGRYTRANTNAENFNFKFEEKKIGRKQMKLWQNLSFFFFFNFLFTYLKCLGIVQPYNE